MKFVGEFAHCVSLVATGDKKKGFFRVSDRETFDINDSLRVL
jgi:hypothetical protein